MFSIIPIKPFDQAKTRLAPVLSAEKRGALSCYLLERTIGLACQVGEVVVISRDAEVRRLAKRAGAWALVEGGADLNGALRQAVGWVKAQGGQTALILPGDLPLLQVADLTGLIEAGRRQPAVVIAPSRRLDGTNALLLRPPDVLPLAFGPDSFHRHCRLAHAAGLDPIIYRSARLAFDLDLPEDFAVWPEESRQVGLSEDCR